MRTAQNINDITTSAAPNVVPLDPVHILHRCGIRGPRDAQSFRSHCQLTTSGSGTERHPFQYYAPVFYQIDCVCASQNNCISKSAFIKGIIIFENLNL